MNPVWVVRIGSVQTYLLMKDLEKEPWELALSHASWSLMGFQTFWDDKRKTGEVFLPRIMVIRSLGNVLNSWREISIKERTKLSLKMLYYKVKKISSDALEMDPQTPDDLSSKLSKMSNIGQNLFGQMEWSDEPLELALAITLIIT